jgi:hypothetical protein
MSRCKVNWKVTSMSDLWWWPLCRLAFRTFIAWTIKTSRRCEQTWQRDRERETPTWQLARLTMPTAWQLEQKMPVWREKQNWTRRRKFFFLHRVCVLVVFIIMEYFSHQNPLVRVSWRVLSVQRNGVGMKWIVHCTPPPPICLPMDLNDWQKHKKVTLQKKIMGVS